MIDSSFLKNTQKETLGEITIFKTEGFPKNYNGHSFKHAWKYPDRTWVARYENQINEKITPPFNTKDKNGVWKYKKSDSTGLQKMFGLDLEYEGSKGFFRKPLYFFEGEKCATAGQYTGLNSTTTIGGSSGLSRSDLSILLNYEEIVIIPDNDEAGKKYSKALLEKLSEIGYEGKVTVKAFNPSKKNGYDICDWLKERFPLWDELNFIEEFEESATSITEELLKELTELKIDDENAEQDWLQPIETKDQDYSCEAVVRDSDTTPKLNALIQKLHLHLEVPVPFIQGTVLTLISAAAQNIFQFKSSKLESLSQPIGLYTMAFLKSGERKGGVWKYLLKPFEKLDKDLKVDFTKAYDLWKVEHDKACDELKVIGKINKDSDKDHKKQVHAAEDSKAELESKKPKPTRMLIDNLTPEAMVRCLQSAPYGTVLASEEPRDFIDIFTQGRYSAGKSQYDILLKSYDGATIRVDRATAKGPGAESYSETIEKPRLSILISGQPHVINTITDSELSNSGFLARFNIICPPSMVGKRSVNMFDNPTPKTELTWYNNLIYWITNFKDQGPIYLELDEGAENYLQTKLKELEPHFLGNYSSAVMGTKANKLSGLSVRLACNVHLIESYSAHGYSCKKIDTTISLSTFKKAWAITEFFLEHHKILEKAYSENNQILVEFYSWLKTYDKTSFNLRSLRRDSSPLRAIQESKKILKSKRDKKITKILKDAEDLNWIRKGKDKTSWEINPHIT